MKVYVVVGNERFENPDMRTMKVFSDKREAERYKYELEQTNPYSRFIAKDKPLSIEEQTLSNERWEATIIERDIIEDKEMMIGPFVLSNNRMIGVDSYRGGRGRFFLLSTASRHARILK